MTYPVAQLLTSSSFHPVRTELAETTIKAALQDFTITTVPPELLVFEDRKIGNKALHKEPVIIHLAGFDVPLGKFQKLQNIPILIYHVGKTVCEYQS